MHLIPSYILIIVLALTWKWEWIGGIIFLILDIIYFYMMAGRVNILFSLPIGLPLFLISIMFFVGYFYKRKMVK